MLSKGKQIFENIYNERLDRIEELTKKINYDELNFIVENSSDGIKFTKVADPMAFLHNIKTRK